MLAHLLYCAIRLPLWGYVAYTFATVQLMLLGVSLYLRRDQSHGGLVLHPVLRHFFRFCLWFCSGTVLTRRQPDQIEAIRDWFGQLPFESSH